MTKKLLLLAAIFGLFGIAGLGKDSFAAGSVVTKINESFPFDFSVTNPCDSSGNSDVTGTGVVDESGTLITLPDGSTNGTIRISAHGDGTDTNNNAYRFSEMVVEQVVHAQPDEGEVVVVKAISATGQGFIMLFRFAELKNHTIDNERTICLGN